MQRMDIVVRMRFGGRNVLWLFFCGGCCRFDWPARLKFAAWTAVSSFEKPERTIPPRKWRGGLKATASMRLI